MSEKPQEGNWTLVSPDGRTFVAESPIRCCRRETEERIPAEVRVKRLVDFLNEQEGNDEDKTVTEAIQKTIELYRLKVEQQETLELELQKSITRKRGRREDNAPERAEIAAVRARKQCYVQTIVDVECLLD